MKRAGLLFLIFLAVLVRLGSERNNAFRLTGTGVLAGLGLVTRASALLAFPGFALLIFGAPRGDPRGWRDPVQWRTAGRDLSWFALGLLPAVAFNVWYNYVRFGSWLTTGYEQKSPIWFGNSIALGLADFLLSPGRGLLLYVPILLASPFLFRRFWKHAPVFALAVVVTSAVYLLAYSQFGGLGLWAWGPHYLLPIIPLLALPWGEAFEAWGSLSRRRQVILLGLAGASLGVQFLSASAAYLRTYIRGSIAGVEYDRTYDWRVEWSPLLLQGANLAHSLDNMAAGRQFEFVTTIHSREYLLERDITLNVLDWWWVLAMYRGMKWAWLAPLAVLAASSLAWRKLRKSEG